MGDCPRFPVFLCLALFGLFGAGLFGASLFGVPVWPFLFRLNSPTVAGMSSSDLIVTEWGDDSIAPTIDGVETISTDTVRIQLSQPIAPGAWTVITHLASGTSVWLGSLPGDVNNDGVSAPSDILAVIDCLNGTAGHGCGDAQLEVDRSGEAGPADILQVIDLLNGAGSFDAWLNTTLGSSPCGS